MLNIIKSITQKRYKFKPQILYEGEIMNKNKNSICTNITFDNTVELDNYGVYIKGKFGYERIKLSKRVDVTYEYIHEIPIINPSNRGLELIVCLKDLNVDGLVFETRLIESPEMQISITPIIKKIHNDQYQVKFKEEIPQESILLIYYGYFVLYKAAFVDPIPVILKHYKQNAENISSITAIWAIEKLLKAYPKNKDLKNLMKYWQDKQIEAKFIQQYEFV